MTKISFSIPSATFQRLTGAERLCRRPPGWGLTWLLLFVSFVAGCSTQEKIVYDPVNTRPIVGDDAMALRADWPRSVCLYPNGDVTAWSTRYPYQTSEARAGQANVFLDTVTFVAESALLPVELVANPPFQPQVWYGVKYPPTYTANPPLPPTAQQAGPDGPHASY